MPIFPFPWRIALPLFWDVLRAGRRSFQADAHKAVSLLPSPIKIINPANIPSQGPALLVANHYSRPGFQAWWIALTISAALPMDIHWMMTNTWTFLGPLAPVSRRALTRVARVYNFTSSPSIPPQPEEIAARALAVRRILKIARTPGAVIGLVPEGRDYRGGILGPLPSGAGRFIEQIAKTCQPIVPIGVYEEDGALRLRFGEPLTLPSTAGKSAAQRDQLVDDKVMRAIAQQLPPHLRGRYKS